MIIGRWRRHCIRSGRSAHRSGTVLLERDESGDPAAQTLDAAFPILEQVDPIARCEFIGQRVIRQHVLGPCGDDSLVVLARERQLLLYFMRVVGVVGKYQDHDFSGPYRPYDQLLKIFAGSDIAAGDPARNPTVLQRRANRARDLGILGRVADEDASSHDRGDSCGVIARSQRNRTDMRWEITQGFPRK